MMKRMGVATLMVLLCGPAAAAQDSLEWLIGRWSEQIRPQKAATDRSSRILQVEVTDAILRVTELSEDGDDMRCRLDGTETRSTKVKPKATVEYLLKCKTSRQSLEIRGRALATGMSGIPPQQFEVEDKYELAKDGSLRARLRMRGLIQGLPPIDIVDERTDFNRSQ